MTIDNYIYDHRYKKREEDDLCECCEPASSHADTVKGDPSLRFAVLWNTRNVHPDFRHRKHGPHDKICKVDEDPCEYCAKYYWVLKRATSYSIDLNMPLSEILEGWEHDRDYWYLNYYQECNQPVLTGTGGMPIRIVEDPEDFMKQIDNRKEFICPKCGRLGPSYQECEGRKDGNELLDCDWASYGLFKTMGKGVIVVMKRPFKVLEIFMPAAWAEEYKKS